MSNYQKLKPFALSDNRQFSSIVHKEIDRLKALELGEIHAVAPQACEEGSLRQQMQNVDADAFESINNHQQIGNILSSDFDEIEEINNDSTDNEVNVHVHQAIETLSQTAHQTSSCVLNDARYHWSLSHLTKSQRYVWEKHVIKIRENYIARERYEHLRKQCLLRCDDTLNLRLEAAEKHVQDTAFKTFIMGAAGTGKSWIMKLLCTYLWRLNGQPASNADMPIKILAPTGAAAFNVRGDTIHSALSLPVQETLHGMPELTPLKLGTKMRLFHSWKPVTTVFIDEISMVGSTMLHYINSRLKHIKDVAQNSSVEFGGLNVIAFGDFHQAAPIKDNYIWEPPQKGKTSTDRKLWTSFLNFELLESKRQEKDPKFFSLLNCLAKKKIGEDISLQHMQVLRSRFSKKIAPNGYEGIDCNSNEWLDAIRLYPTYKKVKSWNQQRLKSMLKQKNKIKHQWKAIVETLGGEISEQITDETMLNKILSKDDRKNGSLPHLTEMCVGARVMLRHNVDKTDGLVNGATGTILGFEYKNKNRNAFEMPVAIRVRFDNQDVGLNAKQQLNFKNEKLDYVLIYPRSVKVRRNSKKYQITNFPLILSWAMTIHKSQGLTIKSKLCVDLGNDMFNDGYGLAYVALSRVTKLEDLCILNFARESIFCHRDVEKAISSMDKG